jgi:hypothetical protein
MPCTKRKSYAKTRGRFTRLVGACSFHKRKHQKCPEYCKNRSIPSGKKEMIDFVEALDKKREKVTKNFVDSISLHSDEGDENYYSEILSDETE